MNELFDLEGKTIVITGGTGILGSEWAAYLTQNGAKVIVLGRTQEEVDTTKSRLAEIGLNVEAYPCDVINEDACNAVATQIKEVYGNIDVLVNAAGGNMKGATISPEQSVLDSDTEALRTIIDLNYIGTYLTIKAFLPQFIEAKKGNIINISSMSAEKPLTRVMGYSSSKAAINNLTQWLAVEFAQKYGEGIRVNAIAPGFFLTEQNRTLLTNEDGSYTNRAKLITNNTPMNRFGQPNDLLGAMHFLCSEASKFVTGIVMPVDGGFSAFSGV
ncbi:SDR family oxidoreductase [Winogradskyella sp.]|uniref:SDR family oxidoreductase n=1 Tax=Winogradskyella sp. TaxID=1883156 RepID=UPI00260C51FB|nr:SDR family oxidoreductase [Winogradskyella sp.]